MKMFLTSIVLIFSLTAKCQLDKGIWLLGGTGNFSSSKNIYSSPALITTSNSTTIKISPNIGYFIIDKLSIGVKVSYSQYKDIATMPIGAVSNVKRFEFGPFLRYYFLAKEKDVNILSEISYQYGKYSFNPSKGNINTISFLVGPAIYFNSSVALEFLAGYYSRIENVGQQYKSSQKSFQIAIGFQFHLEK